MIEDWLDVSLEFSKLSSQESGTVEDNIMKLLLKKIEILLDVPHRRPNRICTLHKIIGDRVIFDQSTKRQPPGADRQVNSIREGLIGQAIQEGNDVSFFRDANQLENYIPGWENCQSELIGLIKYGMGKLIGVVNIESDIPGDFLCDDNPNINPQRDDLRRSLENLVRIACGYLLLTSKIQALIQDKESSSHLIETISTTPIITLYNVSNTTFCWLAGRTELLRVVFYRTDLENEKQYVKIANYGKGKALPENIPDSEGIRSLSSSDVYNISKIKIAGIFGNEFSENFTDGLDGSQIYFEASKISDVSQKRSMRYFVGIIVAQQDNIDDVRTCCGVLKNTLIRYLQNEANQASQLLAEITIDMYEKALKEDNFRTVLNHISSNIANRTSAQFCLIYLVAPDDYYHSSRKIYLGGAGGGEVDFENVRFNPENSLVADVIRENKNRYYSNFYNCPIKTDLLDHFLRRQNLEAPEVFAFPLFQKEADITLGALVVLRENSSAVCAYNTPKVAQVNMMLAKWSSSLSSIIYNGDQKQADSILSETYSKLIEIISCSTGEISNNQMVSNIQKHITKNVLPIWREILKPAFFVIYKQYEENYRLLDASVLTRNNDATPPVFRIGQGLTGAVMQMKRKELYEPFVEDLEDGNVGNSSYLAPDSSCKDFWDYISGSKRRMYYGRHFNVNGNNYVLLIVGVRKNKFSPSLGYKLSHDFIDTVFKYIKAALTG